MGDRVLAQWPAEQQWWYPGVICGVEGKFEIQYDDGGRDQIDESQLQPLNIQTGARVYSRFKGGAQYYPGKVSQVVGNAYHVDYDDGDKEWTSVSMFRVNRNDL